VYYVPVSALYGENVASRSDIVNWYSGPSILELLETAQTYYLAGDGPGRFPVQYVIRPRGRSDDHHDFRGFAGQIASGTFRVGQEVLAMSSGRTSTIESIRILDQQLPECRPPQSVVMTLKHDIDIGRGEVIVPAGEPAPAARELDATLVWMGPAPLQLGKRYLLRHTTQFTPAVVAGIESRLNIHTMKYEAGEQSIAVNDICIARVRTASPVFVDPYARCRETGGFVLIDPTTNDTCGAGLVRGIVADE
jgi:sulfate adenylyltransferase subunit 1